MPALRNSLLVLLVVDLICFAEVQEIPENHARAMTESRELFSKSVRTLLVDNCLKCHGADRTRGGLDLSTREALLRGGDSGIVVTPGKGKNSRLVLLASHAEEPHMPPPSSGKKLTAGQLAELSRWIDLGAAYDKPLIEKKATGPKTLVVTADDRKFWSFAPLSRPVVPPRSQPWGNHPVDAFLLARLHKQKIAPSPIADRRTLLRGLSFGLTGLPPTPEELHDFLNDPRPDAYERLVDRLLASPAHGERWARHWLDNVRFAESHGFEHDYDRPHAYHYRDFVIRAFNSDLGYDQFIRWQIAGDEIEPDNPLALTATGFLGAGVHSTQITANTVEKERYDELDDIVKTLGTSMLGLTIGCARCHDHKYDPLPMTDYYRLVATFTRTVRSDQEIEIDPEQARLARQQHQNELDQLAAQMQRYEREELPKRVTAWLAGRKKGQSPSLWSVIEPTQARSAGGAEFVPQADGSLLATGKNVANDTYTFTFETRLTDIRALRLEALAHPSLGQGGPGRAANGNFALSDVRLTAAPLTGGPAQTVRLIKARATFEQRGLPVAAAIDDNPTSSWAVDPQFGKDHAAVFDLAEPVNHLGGTRFTLTLHFNNNTQHSIGRPRLSLTSQASPPATSGDGVPLEVRLALGRADRGEAVTSEDRLALARWLRSSEPGWRQLQQQLTALKQKGPSIGKVKAMICSEGLTPVRLHSQGDDFLPHTHFLLRGDPNQKAGIATQAFPQILTRTPEGAKRWQQSPPPGSRTPYLRRSLANWIVDVDHGAGHLLARVIVNRLWQYHFGRGIVATSSDFGLQGERPTHPELLDWLACELIDSGWSLKHIHRLIVTSAAYQQSSQFEPARAALDPENRLLWRRTPRRLEAEAIRDALFAVSGQLDRRAFGPGSLDPMQPRRAIYFFIKRSQLIPLLVLFDAPDGTVGIEQRTTTTIAPQALLLLNNPVVRRAADQFARRLANQADPQKSVRLGYELALGRQPSSEEIVDSLAFLAEQEKLHTDERRSEPAHRARVDFCQVLFGLNEFLYVD